MLNVADNTSDNIDLTLFQAEEVAEEVPDNPDSLEALREQHKRSEALDQSCKRLSLILRSSITGWL